MLDGYAAEGFTDSYDVGDGGALIHAPTGTSVPAGEVEVVRFRRLEGASDPSDMVLVAAVRSAATGDGAVVVKYGPEASEGEADLLVAWQDELARTERE